MEKSPAVSLAVLLLINITDSVIYSVVTPSLVFYVTDVGGTVEQYGAISSAVYLSGLVTTSFYGAWVDGNGHKYKAPYAAAFAMGIIGSLMYFLAVLCPKGIAAVAAIFLGRLVAGLGASGRSLAFSWIGLALPRGAQRPALLAMAMTRIVGMMLGPLLNLLVARVDAELAIFGAVVPVNPYNSVGLIIAFAETVLLAATFLFLVDPPAREGAAAKGGEPARKAGWREIASACASNFELVFSLLGFFVVNVNFTFYNVAIPPVGRRTFDWTPVEISYVLAAHAAALLVGIISSMAISMKTKATDSLLIGCGNGCFLVGGTMMYYWWTTDSTPTRFVVPVLIASLAIPFIGPTSRSKFTHALHGCPELEHSHGLMQGFMTQADMIGSFVSPNFATNFVLRSPEEMDAVGARELSPWAWYIPATSMAAIVALIYESLVLGGTDPMSHKEEGGVTTKPEEVPSTEKSKLLA